MVCSQTHFFLNGTTLVKNRMLGNLEALEGDPRTGIKA